MIRVLDPHVANKIAAGEVVERPASVVKELVENALDAGADRIQVELEEGGKKLIRVTDNGRGMDGDDLVLAFAPHATSKIENVDDLFRIVTYGFRGEALASIGSVARASIVTREAGAPLGRRIECRAGGLSEVKEIGAPEGTVVEVRDLFFNTPVRRKFLKRDAAEVAQVSETLTRIVLPRPDVSLVFTHNGRKVLSCERTEGLRSRAIDLFGADLRDRLLAVSGRRDGISVAGWIGSPEVARRTASRQYMFVNDRYVKDRGLGAAVSRAYEDYILPRHHAVFFLDLTLDPETVDVNVHPTKIEVRFREKNAVFSAVYHACRGALVQSAQGAVWAPPAEAGAEAAVAESTGPADAVQETLPLAAPSATPNDRVRRMEHELFPHGTPRTPAAPRPETRRACSHHADPRPMTGEFRFLQIHDSYLLVEDDRGFRVIDQHALHERMMFEALLERAGRGEAASQPLLVPEVVELSPSEAARVLDLAEELAALGMTVEPFSGNSVAIQSLPLDLAHRSGAALLAAVLALDEERASTGFSDARRAMLAGMACRAAVKFNERLPEDEIRAMLQWHVEHPEARACAHGRPVCLELSLEELERRFLRKD